MSIILKSNYPNKEDPNIFSKQIVYDPRRILKIYMVVESEQISRRNKNQSKHLLIQQNRVSAFDDYCEMYLVSYENETMSSKAVWMFVKILNIK